MSGGGSRRPAPGRDSGRGAGGGLVAGNMFTPGSAGGRPVLVWEGPAALRTAGAQVGAGQWCDKVAPVVVSYHTGGKNRSSSGLPQEMTRQLDGQFTALSLMSAKEILAGMATFDERKRSPASHTTIRQKFQDKLADNLWKRHNFSPEVAGLWASRAMKELAVLHNPDQLLSGPQGPSLVGGAVALGDRVTNSAVGAQTAQEPRELIRAAAQAAVDAGQGDRLLRMRVVLTDSPKLSRDLNKRLEALEPRSLDEREAVSPRGPPLTPQVLSDRLAQLPGGPDGLEDLTRNELRQALTQPEQTPDHQDIPAPDAPAPERLNAGTPDGLRTGAPDMTGSDGPDHATGLGDEPLPGDRAPDRGAPGLDNVAGQDGGAPEMGAPSTGSLARQEPVVVPVAGQPISDPAERVTRPMDPSPSMSAPTPDLNAPDKGTPAGGAPDGHGRSAPNAGTPDGNAPGEPGRGVQAAVAQGASFQPQAPAAELPAPPSVPPVSAERAVVPAHSEWVVSSTAPEPPAPPSQPAQQNQPTQPGQTGQTVQQGQPGRPSQPVQSGRPVQASQSGRRGQPSQPVQTGLSGLSGRGGAGGPVVGHYGVRGVSRTRGVSNSVSR